MKTVSEYNQELKQIDQDIRQAESNYNSAHAALVNATRSSTNGGGLSELVSAEGIASARREALQQLKAEAENGLKLAQLEANSQANVKRQKEILGLKKELTAAAVEAERAYNALEKIVNDAIDNKHTALRVLLNNDPTLSAADATRKAQSDPAFEYLYHLYVFMKKDRARAEMIAGFQRNAERIATANKPA